jgi:hypothetical protein
MIDKIIYYLKIIKRTPKRVLLPLIFMRFKNIIKDTYNYKKAIQIGVGLTEDEFIRELKLKNYQHNLKRIIDYDFLNSIINSYGREFIRSGIDGTSRVKILDKACEIRGHIFDLLGSGREVLSYNLQAGGFEGYSYNKKINGKKYNIIKERIKKTADELLSDRNIEDYEPIDWHRDFKSGYRWDEDVWYKHIRYGHKPGIDIKVPWELSRFHHLITLGQAYTLTKDEKYAREYAYQLIDWIENNRVQFGPNWLRTMEVSIRAANWVMSMAYFKDSKYITNKFWLYLAKNIYIHGKHVINNLEYGSITSNHYLSNISGLFFISMLFGKHKCCNKWLIFSISELKKEMKKQVYDDGIDFESSTFYHRLVLELFFYPVFYYVKSLKGFVPEKASELVEKNFGREFLKILRGMFDFILSAMKPDGTMPQVGDNDNGRLFVLSYNGILDMRYIITIASIFFSDEHYKIDRFGFDSSSLWLFGKKGLSIWNRLGNKQLDDIGSRAFEKGGFVIMRNGSDYLFSSCSPNGQNGNGGHAHNDKLGFELIMGGDSIIVDPGTFIYTPSPMWRNTLRSTASHNTVMIDEKEQNRFKENNLFSMEDDARAKINKWITNSEYDFLEAEHYGYRRFEDPVTHRRQIILDRNRSIFIIRDILSGNSKHSILSSFNLYPGIECIISNDKSSAIIYKDDRKLANIVFAEEDKWDKIFLEDYWYSESYGKKIPGKALRCYKVDVLPAVTTVAVVKNYCEPDMISDLLKKFV